MNILFNSSGIPLLMQSTYIFGETTGTPQNEMKDRARILSPYDLSNVSYIDIDGLKIRPWGDENDSRRRRPKRSETPVCSIPD